MQLLTSKIGQIIIFQLQWWLCVLSVQHRSLHYGYVGALVIAVLLVCLLCRTYQKIILFLVLAMMGIVNDTLLMHAKILVFSGAGENILIPAWLMTLWFCFCIWFVNATWLNQKYLLFAVFASFGGPLSYYAGLKLGALTFSQSVLQVLLLIGMDWFLLSLIFVRLLLLLNTKEDV